MKNQSTMKVTIITPDYVAFEGEASFLAVRASDGDLGIMPNHAPLLAALEIWPMKLVIPDKGDSEFAVFGGFMDVNADGVTIVTPNYELPEAIDKERAERAKKRAEERLADKSTTVDHARAKLALRRALTRLDIVSRRK